MNEEKIVLCHNCDLLMKKVHSKFFDEQDFQCSKCRTKITVKDRYEFKAVGLKPPFCEKRQVAKKQGM